MAFMQCLAIQTADPRSVCWAGGNLEGEVTLVLTDPTVIRGIRLSYRCEAHIDYLDDGQEVEEEEEEEAGTEGESGGKRGHRHRKKKRFLDSVAVTPKRRSATEKFLETTSILWGTEPNTTYGEVMPAGHHALAFDIRVPQQLPGSFEGRYGFVRHWLECVVDRPGASDMATKRALSVISHCDLNKDPVAAKSIHHREEVILCCGCVKPDHYDVSYELPYRGYVPGETMFPNIRLRNFTRNLINLSVRLQMITTYRAKTRRKITTKVVAEDKKVVHRGEVTKWEPSLQVPALPPTGLGGCHIIDVRFCLEVELTSQGMGWQGLAFQDEVKVGTIPLLDVVKYGNSSAHPLASKTGVLLGPAHPSSRDSKANNQIAVPPFNRASSSSTGEGRFTSDADSASPLARLGGAGVGRGGHKNHRSSSIISAVSHWSFNPMVPPRTPHALPWKFPGRRAASPAKAKAKAKKTFTPTLATIYRC
ncbi:arrestin domain-containing protein 1-like [Babylonia areolata]|uniref:arrestin domain-containing protein 1-like n=1 Tax=Babylonia areolata TaxID=304850 RepID=UPI003FD66047